MKSIPGWDVRAFSCDIEAHHLTVTGSITHVSREGWQHDSEQYVVDALVRNRTYKFTIVRDSDMWTVKLLSTFTDNATISDRRIAGIHTFLLENERIEFLFEEALMRLCTYKDEEQ